jgi:hypothetical protein
MRLTMLALEGMGVIGFFQLVTTFAFRVRFVVRFHMMVHGGGRIV